MNKQSKIKIPPSIFNAYHICKRQAWLMHRQLNADQHNDFLIIGNLIDESSFKREKKSIYLAEFSAIIDMVTKKDGSILIAEIKKSSKRIENAKMQLKYYLYILYKKGIKVKGELKFPKEKKVVEVELLDSDIEMIEGKKIEIDKKIKNEKSPDKVSLKFCKKCAHFEFCWA